MNRRDWPSRTLSDITSAPIVYGIVQPGEPDLTGVPFIQTRDISGDLDREGLDHVSQRVATQYQRSAIRTDDVLVALRGQIGSSAIVPSTLDGANISRGVARLRISTENAHPDFVHQILQANPVRQAIEAASRGSTLREISIGALRAITVPTPPLPEQRKIADILGAWDETIELAQSLRSTHLQRRAWLRENVVTGLVRLPGFVDNWERSPLSSVLSEHGKRSTGSEEVFSVSVHKGLVNQVEHLGRSHAATSTANYNRVHPDDIVYTKSPTGEFPLGIIKQSKVKQSVLVSPLYGVFTPRTAELGAMLHAYFESPISTANYLGPLVQKGAKNTIAITNRRFLEGSLSLPSDESEQAAIVAVLDASSDELALLDRQIALLKEQKRGLMQKLLTGDIRVTVDSTEEVTP